MEHFQSLRFIFLKQFLLPIFLLDLETILREHFPYLVCKKHLILSSTCIKSALKSTFYEYNDGLIVNSLNLGFAAWVVNQAGRFFF